MRATIVKLSAFESFFFFFFFCKVRKVRDEIADI